MRAHGRYRSRGRAAVWASSSASLSKNIADIAASDTTDGRTPADSMDLRAMNVAVSTAFDPLN